MNKNAYQLHTKTIILMIILSTLIDYVLADQYEYVTLLSPLVGIAITIYFLYGKRSFLPIVITYTITLAISRVFWYSEVWYGLLFVVSSKVIVLIFMMITFRFIMYYIPNSGYSEINTRDILNYIAVAIFVTFLGATLNILPIQLLFQYEVPLFWYGNTFIGFMFGLFIFGSSLNFSLIYDKRNGFTGMKIVYAVLYLLTFTVITMYIFGGAVTFINFHDYAYIFLLLYIIATLRFNYIIVFCLNIIMFFMYSIFLFDHGVILDLSNELFSIILIIISLTAATSLIKIYTNTIEHKEYENEKMNETLKELILSTNSMLAESNIITESEDLRSIEFLKRIFKVGCNIFKKYDMASCYLIKDKVIRYICADGYDIDYLNELKFPAEIFDFTFTKPKIVEIKEELYGHDSFFSEKYRNTYPSIKQSVRFTIYFDNNPIAGMAFDITRVNPNSYGEEDLVFFEQYHSLINSYYSVNETYNVNNTLRNDIVMSLVRALGLFDSYTGVHSEEVAYLSMQMAKKLKLGQIQSNRIYWAAVVHDIGKLGIKESVLQKKGPLTSEEKKLVEGHTIKGYDILRMSKGLEDIALRVKYHHERWDGLGYPDQLKGKEIPLCSQIIAICDSVSAMFQDRVYSKARSNAEIIDELKAQRGKQFSPKVTDVMVEYIKETQLVQLRNLGRR